MIRADLGQRIEEIGLALAETFKSEKPPLVRNYDAGEMYFIQLSWVLASRGDTTLDARCEATLKLTPNQIVHYANAETTRRIELQSQLQKLVRDRVAGIGPLPEDGECAVDIVVPDELLDSHNP